MPPQLTTIDNPDGLHSRSSSPTSAAGSAPVVVIVDPYSTGCLIAQEIAKRGCLLLALWTHGFSNDMKTHIPMSAGPMHYFAQVEEQEAANVAATAQAVRAAAPGREIVACLAGGEAGVDLADALSEHLGLRTNGTAIANRRDKQLQQELIRKVGLRSVRQACGSQLSQVQDFLQSESYPLVLKPVESAGSDGVKLCNTYTEAKNHFALLMKSQMVNGGACPAVLCQEFLQGPEYVVDHVSRDGVHKTMMVWVYDKRPANGSDFVYFGCVPVDSKSPEAQIVIPYIRGVLDALAFANGPSHGEVILTDQGPCLVEMNCRAHGGDGNWRPLCQALTGGYSQVEATVDAYLEDDEAHFLRLPDVPPSPFLAHGQEVILVSYSQGTVHSCPGYEVMKKLPSFHCLETGIRPGSVVDFTVDLFTGIGSVILMHRDPAVLRRDLDFVRYLEEINGLFVYETKLTTLNRPSSEALTLKQVATASGDAQQPQRGVFFAEGPTLIRHFSNDRPELRTPLVRRMTTVDSSKECVVVIDPYSTGCLIVEEISKRGYQVIALWTNGFAPAMKTHVPMSCGPLKYLAQLEEKKNNSLADTAAQVKKAAGKLRLVACLAGGEAGVDMADALSEHLQVRTNGTAIPNKRDKKIQQELIQKRGGLRSVRQAAGDTFDQVKPFLQRQPFPVVLKPIESAGSDGVKLCHNMDEAKQHFDVLMKSQMVNGGACPAVLCQEFLRGKEYVVDHVSRDGVHKTVMVWVYDKRPANGSAFVYFGCLPVDSQSPEAKLLIPYVRRVLNALDIRNGPSHAEVMMMNDGPCLVEMNCRAHGGDGSWRPLCRALNGGYSQVETSVDAYLDSRQFQITPERPPSPFKASGQECILVSYSRGVVKATPGFDRIQKLQSFVSLETGVKKGSKVDYTVDLFTGIGSVILMHADPRIVENDVAIIRRMETENQLFEYEIPEVLFSSPSNVIDALLRTITIQPPQGQTFY